MANQKRFIAKNGLDGNNLTIVNLADPVGLQDAVTLNFGRNASNLTTGTVDQARLPDLSATYQTADPDLTAIGALTGTTGILTKTNTNTWVLDTTSYQPIDNDLTAIAALAGTTGFLTKTGVDTWVLDTNSYVNKTGDTMTGFLTLHAAPTSNLHAATKSYVDGLSSGINWISPILDPNLKDDSLTAPPTPVSSEVYIVSTPATGAWVGLEGHAVFWNGSTWTDLLDRAVAIGDRFGVLLEFDTQTPAGGLAAKLGNVVQITDATPGSITYTYIAPTTNMATFVSAAPNSLHFGHSYTYNSNNVWVEFSGPSSFTAGNGIDYTNNILSVKTASATRIAVNASGVDLASGVATPGDYHKVTVDTYGRVTAGTNPIAFENDITVTADYTITTGKNAVSAGPINIANGITVTVPTGSTWTIV